MIIKPLLGQSALVTGATSGIGRSIAEAYAEAGAAVAVNYRSKEEEQTASEFCRELRDNGGNAISIRADVAAEGEVRQMVSEVVDAFGGLDILVANSGVQQDSPFRSMSLADWRKVIDVNLTGSFLCAREAVNRFMDQGEDRISRAKGKIIFMSSVHEIIPWAGHVNYAASKGGIHLLMQSLALEVASEGIRVNSIAPGFIKTRINQKAWESDAQREKSLTKIPYGRLGEPEDVARAAVWLASDESDYVTGTTLLIDGGMALYAAFPEPDAKMS